MATSKRKRKYSQDFSGHSRTDESFAPACDVNNIVRHYQNTGIDPYQDRLKQARYEEATTLTYADAMRQKAELDSYIAENPDWRERHSEAPEEPIASTPDANPPEEGAAPSGAKPAPQGASDDNSEA